MANGPQVNKGIGMTLRANRKTVSRTPITALEISECLATSGDPAVRRTGRPALRELSRDQSG